MAQPKSSVGDCEWLTFFSGEHGWQARGGLTATATASAWRCGTAGERRADGDGDGECVAAWDGRPLEEGCDGARRGLTATGEGRGGPAGD
ncbi:unnamed protein product [Linum trigynum]|uniref:Uncharacterized protein n=1 Tax=Linum trigynum TaxID=586398 RepID=A0AAV2D5A8_9ROSI